MTIPPASSPRNAIGWPAAAPQLYSSRTRPLASFSQRMSAQPPSRPSGLLERLGLHRRELRAWAMYDWAVSAVQTTIMVAVFPIFFKTVAAADLPDDTSTQYVAVANSVAMALIAVLSPILGALADYTGAHKRLLGTFMGIGASAVAAMFFIGRGDVELGFTLFVLALVGAAGSMVF